MTRKNDVGLSIAYKIRKSPKWLHIRRMTLSQRPLCEDPFGDHAKSITTQSATQVHHIKGLREHPELWNDPDNLQCLCTKCHSKIEQAHRKNCIIEAVDPIDETQITGNKYF